MMMEFVTIPTEQTTAFTDALLGFEAFLLMGYLQRFAPPNRPRARCWQSLLLLTALASFVGAVAHGIVMSKTASAWLWKPLLLILGLVVANLILATVHDLRGPEAAKRSRPWLIALAVVFFGLTQVRSGTFFIFILYEAVGMLFGLVAYGRLWRRQLLSGAGMIAWGIILQLVAAAAQASGPFEFKILWVFDHNGLFHLIGMVATCIMMFGVARGFSMTPPCGSWPGVPDPDRLD